MPATTTTTRAKEKLAAQYEQTGDYKSLDLLQSENPRLKRFRVKNDDPGLHLQIQALHMTSEKAQTRLTGKQLRKEGKALRHADDGVRYNLPKPPKKHVGRRAKARIAAKVLRQAVQV